MVAGGRCSSGTEQPKKLVLLRRNIILATLLALCLAGPAWSQHGGAGGSHGGGFGHAGGGRASHGHRDGGSHLNSPGMHHRAPFGLVFSLFDRSHNRSAFRTCESFNSECGAGVYGVVGCGFWDWRCRKVERLTTSPAIPTITSARPLQNNSASSNDSRGMQSFSQGSSQAVTVIWLKGGYGYGLLDYWVQDGLFHYRTTYGGENSVTLNRIDFERTVEDNSQQASSSSSTLKAYMPQHLRAVLRPCKGRVLIPWGQWSGTHSAVHLNNRSCPTASTDAALRF